MKKVVWLFAGSLIVGAGYCVMNTAVHAADPVPAAPAAAPAPAPAPAPAAPAVSPAPAAAPATGSSVVIPSTAVPQKAEETLPKVVAKVGDSEITGKDFGRQIDFFQRMSEMQQGQPLVLDASQRYEILQSEIEKRILELLAAKAHITVQDNEVKAEFENQKKEAAASGEEFKEYLAKLGFSEVDTMEMLRRNMIINRFVESKTKDLKVSDEELKKNYEELKAAGKLDKPESYDVAHILIIPEGKNDAGDAKVKEKIDAGEAKAKEKIDAVRKRIAAGEDFAKVAKEVSQDPESAKNGGLIKDVAQGDMVPEFDKVMTSATVGQVSEPFHTSFGWHILKVEAKKPAGTMDLAESKEMISDWLMNKKTGFEIQKILGEAKASMKIEILLPKPAAQQSSTPTNTPAPASTPASAGTPAEQKAEPAKTK